MEYFKKLGGKQKRKTNLLFAHTQKSFEIYIKQDYF